jgi:hypothetical protein
MSETRDHYREQRSEVELREDEWLDGLGEDIKLCQSCGVVADLQLEDGSWWCLPCDTAARRMGYDDTPTMKENLL